MIENYPNVEEKMRETVGYIVMFSGGAITYEEAWALSGAERKNIEKILEKKMEMNAQSLGGSF